MKLLDDMGGHQGKTLLQLHGMAFHGSWTSIHWSARNQRIHVCGYPVSINITFSGYVCKSCALFFLYAAACSILK